MYEMGRGEMMSSAVFVRRSAFSCPDTGNHMRTLSTVVA